MRRRQRILGFAERRGRAVAALLGLLELSLGVSDGATSVRLGLASGLESPGSLPVRRPRGAFSFGG
jgi:hypothetical protein